MAATKYSINTDRSKAFRSLAGSALVMSVDYRGFVHPIAGVQMRPDVAERVDNYLQFLIMRNRTKLTQALRLSQSRYVIAEPYEGPARSNARFMRFGRRLTSPLLTPNSSGFRSGVKFWGSLTAGVTTGPSLRGAVDADRDQELGRLISASTRPEFSHAVYSSPASTTILTDASAFDETALPTLRSTPSALGSYPASVRLKATPRDDSAPAVPLFSSTESAGASASAVARRVVGARDASLVVDNWGDWFEVVPYGGIRSDDGSDDDRPDEALIDVLHRLEPLISQLWTAYHDMPRAQEELAKELHQGLVQISEEVRNLNRSRIRIALELLLAVVVGVVASLVANAIWHRYEEELKLMIDSLS